MPDPMQPTYYVRHPDDTYSVADPQPIMPSPDGPLVMLCSKCYGWGRIAGVSCAHCNGVGSYENEPKDPQ